MLNECERETGGTLYEARTFGRSFRGRLCSKRAVVQVTMKVNALG
jgi:hypothetical protein